MCRTDVSPGAVPLLVDLMTALTDSLARRYGCQPEDIRVGPVDFGPAQLVSQETPTGRNQ